MTGCLALVLLSAHAKRLSDLSMQNFLLLKKSVFADYVKQGSLVLRWGCIELKGIEWARGRIKVV